MTQYENCTTLQHFHHVLGLANTTTTQSELVQHFTLHTSLFYQDLSQLLEENNIESVNLFFQSDGKLSKLAESFLETFKVKSFRKLISFMEHSTLPRDEMFKNFHVGLKNESYQIFKEVFRHYQKQKNQDVAVHQ